MDETAPLLPPKLVRQTGAYIQLLPDCLLAYTCPTCACEHPCVHPYENELYNTILHVASVLDNLIFLDAKRIYLQDIFELDVRRALELYIYYIDLCDKDLVLAIASFDPTICQHALQIGHLVPETKIAYKEIPDTDLTKSDEL